MLRLSYDYSPFLSTNLLTWDSSSCDTFHECPTPSNAASGSMFQELMVLIQTHVGIRCSRPIKSDLIWMFTQEDKVCPPCKLLEKISYLPYYAFEWSSIPIHRIRCIMGRVNIFNEKRLRDLFSEYNPGLSIKTKASPTHQSLAPDSFSWSHKKKPGAKPRGFSALELS